MPVACYSAGEIALAQKIIQCDSVQRVVDCGNSVGIVGWRMPALGGTSTLYEVMRPTVSLGPRLNVSSACFVFFHVNICRLLVAFRDTRY